MLPPFPSHASMLEALHPETHYGNFDALCDTECKRQARKIVADAAEKLRGDWVLESSSPCARDARGFAGAIEVYTDGVIDAHCTNSWARNRRLVAFRWDTAQSDNVDGYVVDDDTFAVALYETTDEATTAWKPTYGMSVYCGHANVWSHCSGSWCSSHGECNGIDEAKDAAAICDAMEGVCIYALGVLGEDDSGSDSD